MLNGKVRPLGSKGRTPYKVMQGSVCILAFFTCCVPSPRPKKRCVISRGAGARVLARGSVHGRATPTPLASRAALRLWLFLGCNRISGQTQNDIASPCTAILRLACHRVWLYQNFDTVHRTKRTC